MSSFDRPKVRPPGMFYGFHHCNFFVANAKQAADWMCLRMGFKRVAYQGLETYMTKDEELEKKMPEKAKECLNYKGPDQEINRKFCTHVVRQGRIVFSYTSPLEPKPSAAVDFIAKHGDGAKDVAFMCDDVQLIWKKATERGAVSVRPPHKFSDKNGTVIMASLKTYGDCVHTLIQNINYKGPFLPGFQPVPADDDPLSDVLPHVGLLITDHVVGNQPDGKMTEVANWYENTLDFHRFWSVDEDQVHTEYSALRSIVMTDYDRVIKMPLNEPAESKLRGGVSQIQEYVDYHGGPGVQHIALRTPDIIKAVTALRARGMKFLSIRKTYYDDLRKRLASSPVQVREELDVIEKLNILVDFDDKGYLLQIFTQNAEDRPTLFYEVIQRQNHEGFGAGNFKALFESIEAEQNMRRNLMKSKL